MNNAGNQVTLTGRIATDLSEIRFEEGKPIKFLLAVDRACKKDAQKTCDFVPLKAWGILGENLVTYKNKGELITVSAHIESGWYEKDGVQRFSLQIVADSIKYWSTGKGKGNKDNNNSSNNDDSNSNVSSNDDEEKLPFD